MPDELYHTANIRALLTIGFGESQLRDFYMDIPDLFPLYGELSDRSTQDEIARKLLVDAIRTKTVDALLALAKDRNPVRYEENEPYYADEPTSALQDQVVDLLEEIKRLKRPTELTPDMQYEVALHWAQLGRKHSLVRYSLTGRDLSKVDLAGAHLNRADLSDANLEGADMTGARLRYANLRGANLQLATLTDAQLRGADLYGADLDRADLRGADLVGADLRKARFQRSTWSDLTLTDPKWMIAWNVVHTDKGNWSILPEQDFHDADLREASLFRAHLERADLSGADLSGANLREAHLTGANLTEADLTDANLVGARLSGAQVTDEQLAQATTDPSVTVFIT